jgi:putative N6-adenine-specific DNA methylase
LSSSSHFEQAILNADFQYFSPCPRGLEPALIEELLELGIKNPVSTAGGVSYPGSLSDCYAVNLHSRIASRVLLRIAQTRYRNEEDLYKLALAQRWDQWFDVTRTIRVDIAATRSPLRSLEFATLRVKDAICDQFRTVGTERPSVDTRNPGARIFGYLDSDDFILYLDTSGEPLFKRGWRLDTGEAPLRENLAAGILRLSGWVPGETLLDPMCGSGTIVVEAAQRTLGIPPGSRRRFGFENLKNFDEELWQQLKDDAADNAPDGEGIMKIHASDLSGDAVALTRANLARAGLSTDLALKIAPKQVDARHIQAPDEHGVLVTNPPYGERIQLRATTSDDAFFSELGSTLKQRFTGWRCCILSSDLALQGKLRLAPSKRTVLYNGAIECRLYEFRMQAGSLRRKTEGE